MRSKRVVWWDRRGRSPRAEQGASSKIYSKLSGGNPCMTVMLSFESVVSLRHDDSLPCLVCQYNMHVTWRRRLHCSTLNADQVRQPGMHLQREAQPANSFLHSLCIQAVTRGLNAAEALAHALLLPAAA